MPIAISPRRPTLDRIDLSANCFGADGCRSIHEHLQPRFFYSRTAFHITISLFTEDEQFDVGSEVIKKIEIVLTPAAEIIKDDPIVRLDINQTAAVRNI